MLSYVPSELIARVLGVEEFLPVVTATVIDMPAYLNGYVALPRLPGLMTQGMGAGLVLAFMITGLISCIPGSCGLEFGQATGLCGLHRARPKRSDHRGLDLWADHLTAKMAQHRSFACSTRSEIHLR